VMTSAGSTLLMPPGAVLAVQMGDEWDRATALLAGGGSAKV